MSAKEKILIVDDNRTNIEILEEYLEADYELAIATSGEEALQKAPAFQPALILLDIMMPGIDGYEVCRRIRAHPQLRQAKIIMVSAKAMLTERLEGYAAGADDYLTKPFDEEELLAKVRVYLRLKAAEALDQLKGDLLALLGHETCTPLTGIISPVEMLLENENMDLENQRALLTLTYNSAKKLQGLFEKVLLLSEIKAGKTPLRLESTNLSELTRKLLDGFASQAGERKVMLEPQLEEGIVAVLDRDKIKLVIAALVDNAIRFSLPGATVKVTVARHYGECRVVVQDRGEGIEPGFLPRLFDEFAARHTDHPTKCHGLSLAIARYIVQAHLGQIEVDSTKGVGTTVTVRLPVGD
jgi:signal transduction histidine kinase